MDLSTGQVVRTIGNDEILDLEDPPLAQFNSPYGVTLDGQGNLLVADYENNRVVVWNTSDDTPVTVTSFRPPSYPQSLCVDSKGYVIVGGDEFVAVW